MEEYKTNKWHSSDIPVEILASKVHFLANCDHFLSANVSFLDSCQDGNVHTYATTKQFHKKNAFTINDENINKKKYASQWPSPWKLSFKSTFFVKYDHFLNR